MNTCTPSTAGQDAAVEAMAALLLGAESSASLEDAREQAKLLLSEALPHLSARQPVCATVKDSLTVGGGLPVVWVSPGQLEEFRNGTSSFGSRIPARIEKGGLFDMPLYDSPAQAVDLGQFREAVIAAREHHEQTHADMYDTGHAKLRDYDRLLALIDSQK